MQLRAHRLAEPGLKVQLPAGLLQYSQFRARGPRALKLEQEQEFRSVGELVLLYN